MEVISLVLTTFLIYIQKGISLFNRKPSRGIEFLISTKKVGGSPEEVASFLKNTNGLNETVIGDYLGEREEFPLKVMHAYVDSFNFKVMDFGEAIRFFLRGFRLPGEAQKSIASWRSLPSGTVNVTLVHSQVQILLMFLLIL